MILHSDDKEGPCDCKVVVDSARGRNVFKEMSGLGGDGTGDGGTGDGGTGDGVRTVISGGRGLGGSIYEH